MPLAITSSTLPTGTSPSKLQPNAAITERRGTGRPCARQVSIWRAWTAALSAKPRFWLRCMKVSDAQSEIEPDSASRSRCSIARKSPFSFSQSAVYATSWRKGSPSTTASASAHPGTRLGSTNETAWMVSSPVSASARVSSILRAVGMT